MGYLFGQKRRKVGRLQRQAARCFLVTPEADSMELGTWCWPRVVLIEKRPLTECAMNWAARSVGACPSRQRPSAAFCRASGLGHRITGGRRGQRNQQPGRGSSARGLNAAGLLALRRHLTLSSCTNCCAAWEMLPVRFCSQCFRIHTSIAAGFVLICTPSGDVAFAALI